MVDDRLLVTLVMSPSLLMTRRSSDEEDSLDSVFTDVVPVMESVNCFGVSEPVLDLVTIFLASEIRKNTQSILHSIHKI